MSTWAGLRRSAPEECSHASPRPAAHPLAAGIPAEKRGAAASRARARFARRRRTSAITSPIRRGSVAAATEPLACSSSATCSREAVRQAGRQGRPPRRPATTARPPPPAPIVSKPSSRTPAKSSALRAGRPTNRPPASRARSAVASAGRAKRGDHDHLFSPRTEYPGARAHQGHPPRTPALTRSARRGRAVEGREKSGGVGDADQASKWGRAERRGDGVVVAAAITAAKRAHAATRSARSSDRFAAGCLLRYSAFVIVAVDESKIRAGTFA
jgi:hypothetical protein